MANTNKLAAHANSFDMVRLLAALAVVVGHFYPMAGRGDPLDGWWGTDEDLGGFAVLIFFGISGYLITESVLNGASARFYAASRLLRIYPALLVCLVICIIAGIFLTNADLREYFTTQTFQFFAGNLFPFFWQEQRALPAVFVPPWNAMNGPLWTIKYELACYIVVFGVFILPHRLRRYGFVALCGAAVCIWLAPVDAWQIIPPNTADNRVLRFEYFNMGFFRYYVAIFFLAAVARIVVANSPSRWFGIFFFIGCVLVLLHGTSIGVLAVLTTVALAGVCVGASSLFYFNGKYRTTFGDLSYATYLYGWPISLACVLWLLPLTGFWPAMTIAIAATLAVAWASWKLVERPALRLKKLASTEMRGANANVAIGLS